MLIATGLVLAAAVSSASPGASALSEVISQVCQRFAAGDLAFGQSLEGDARLLADVKIASGLQNETLERLGREGVGLIAQSLIGERAAGSDTVVLAVGGQVPGCRSILLSKETGPLADQAASALVAAGWREAPASNAPGAPLLRRMFVKRDAKGDAFLVNLFAGSLPQSDFRLMTTVNRVPSGVELPKGF